MSPVCTVARPPVILRADGISLRERSQVYIAQSRQRILLIFHPHNIHPDHRIRRNCAGLSPETGVPFIALHRGCKHSPYGARPDFRSTRKQPDPVVQYTERIDLRPQQFPGFFKRSQKAAFIPFVHQNLSAHAHIRVKNLPCHSVF